MNSATASDSLLTEKTHLTETVSIILPTYNESKTIAEAVSRIHNAVAEKDIEYEVIIVDDDSPDKTWAVAQDLTDTYPVNVIRRTEESGLATAVMRGFNEANNNVLLVMDADLQHPPERIPKLLTKLSTGSDIVVGSRFVSGGSVGEFNLIRHMMSVVANLLAKILFPQLWNIKDLQSGFFALRRSVIEDVEMDPTGYKILLEVLIRGEYSNVSEVGYKFRERADGDSSMGMLTILNYIRHLMRLRVT